MSREIATKALGLLDALTPGQVEAAITGVNRGARIQVSPLALSRLMAEVEKEFPGILDMYREIRKEGA